MIVYIWLKDKRTLYNTILSPLTDFSNNSVMKWIPFSFVCFFFLSPHSFNLSLYIPRTYNIFHFKHKKVQPRKKIDKSFIVESNWIISSFLQQNPKIVPFFISVNCGVRRNLFSLNFSFFFIYSLFCYIYFIYMM